MLSSWKEIAHFFGKGVRTVQRWEKTLDLPIHRPPGAPSNVVLARTSDLEEWMHRGPVSRSEALDEGTIVPVVSASISLSALEHAVSHLAGITGVQTADSAGDTSMQERIDALAETVANATSKVHAATGIARAA